MGPTTQVSEIVTVDIVTNLPNGCNVTTGKRRMLHNKNWQNQSELSWQSCFLTAAAKRSLSIKDITADQADLTDGDTGFELSRDRFRG